LVASGAGVADGVVVGVVVVVVVGGAPAVGGGVVVGGVVVGVVGGGLVVVGGLVDVGGGVVVGVVVVGGGVVVGGVVGRVVDACGVGGGVVVMASVVSVAAAVVVTLRLQSQSKKPFMLNCIVAPLEEPMYDFSTALPLNCPDDSALKGVSGANKLPLKSIHLITRSEGPHFRKTNFLARDEVNACPSIVTVL